MLSVLLLGATGYLGGTILTDLERDGEYDITCLVRPNRETCMAGRNAKLLLVTVPLFRTRRVLTMVAGHPQRSGSY